MLALIDGGELTARRTAAASALAASYLARSDARHLLVLGTGRLAPNLIAAHMAVRSIDEVTIWGRSREKTEEVVRSLADQFPVKLKSATSLKEALGEADIVSAATLSSEPLIKGALLKPGTHVDLVGAFKPSMRESDDDLVKRAEIFVDTRDGCLSEGGDIVQPIKAGVLSPGEIKADLYELAGVTILAGRVKKPSPCSSRWGSAGRPCRRHSCVPVSRALIGNTQGAGRFAASAQFERCDAVELVQRQIGCQAAIHAEGFEFR